MLKLIEIAQELGISKSAAGRLMDGIEPVEVEGRSKFYSIKQIAEAHTEESRLSPRDRLDEIQADRMQLKYEQEKYDLCRVDNVIRLNHVCLASLKRHLATLPEHISRRIAGITPEEEELIFQGIIHGLNIVSEHFGADVTTYTRKLAELNDEEAEFDKMQRVIET